MTRSTSARVSRRSSLVGDDAVRAARLVLLAVALLAVTLAAWAPPGAQAEQASSHSRAVQAARIDSSGGHTCMIFGNGTVHCWGFDNDGQLGYGNTENIGDDETAASAGPVALGGHDAIAVATGNFHTCALLDDGTVRCWGGNEYGQLGYGNTEKIGDNETPAAAGPVDLGGHKATAITAGAYHTCALLDDGTVRCWGRNNFGQLGYGNTENIGDNETPGSVGPVNLGGGHAVAISAGGFHTCALMSDGTVRCWGGDEYGQLGYGNNGSTQNLGDNEAPGSVEPIELGQSAVAISAGGFHSCAILADHSVRCWGQATYGQLGYGNTESIGDNETPGSAGPVDLGGRGAVAISAGAYNTCVVLDDGTVRCWGKGQRGLLGDLSEANIGDDETPTAISPIELGGPGATAVVAGDVGNCALLADYTVRCWGEGTVGSLGYGNTEDVGDDETPAAAGPVPLGPEAKTGRYATQISGDGGHTCALLDTGKVSCWGYGTEGQLGYGNTESIGDNETPGSVGTVDLGAGRYAVQIAAGGNHTCALLDNGTVRCWGRGDEGQLGYGNTKDIGDNESPASVGPVELGGHNAIEVAAGDKHTCALLDNGTVRCWGNNNFGQLGYGNTENIGDNELPTAVGTVNLGAGRTAVQISTGDFHTCALLDNGTVRCWGENVSGQLGYTPNSSIGDNETPDTAGPVKLGTGRTAVSVSAGYVNTCARLDDGTIRCWGAGGSGQLGLGNKQTIGATSTPDEFPTIGLGEAGRQVWSLTSMTCAILVGGQLRCWGYDADGQLGDGGTENIGDTELPTAIEPVKLGAGRYAVAATGGTAHACALLDDGTVRCWGSGFGGVLGSGNTQATGTKTPDMLSPVDFFDDPPTAVDDTATLDEDNGPTPIDVLANDTDIDGGPKTIESVTQPGHGTVAITGGGTGLTYTPAANYCGPDSFTYTLNGGSTATVSVTVTCVDDPPVAVADSKSITEDDPATPIDVLANDTDIDGGPKTIESVTQPGHGTVAITGGGTGLTYKPEADYCDSRSEEAPDTFTYTLNGGSTATVSVTVTCVDDPPVAVNDTTTLEEDSGYTVIDVLDNDTDVDGGPKSIASVTQPAHGTATKIGGLAVTYAPAANYCGPDSFSYTLAPGGSTATVSVTVTCVDDPPVAVTDSETVGEDSGATPIDVLANDTDIDGGPKTIVAKTSGAHGVVTITGGGTGLTYTPNAHYCGSDTFTYTLNGGSTATVFITVTCVDNPPVAVGDSETVIEDSGPTAIDVLANDTDIDGGPKTIVAKTNGAHGTVSINGSGSSLTYMPAANYCGPDSFTYTLNGGSTATVSITVTCVDDPPVAINDSETVGEDSGATPIDVLANDTDIDGGPKTIAAKTDGAHGTVAITGGGTGLTYMPAANYCGRDSFTYTLAPGSSTATVSVTVTCVDDPPVAVTDSASVIENSEPTTLDVLANDTDIDGGPKTIVSKTDGSHGTVAISSSGVSLAYAPEHGYCGPDSFTYTLNGGSTATVSITVTCLPEAAAPTGDESQPPAPVQETPAAPTQSGSGGPIINITPGVGVVSGRRHPRIAIKGLYAFFTLTCKKATEGECAGTVTITASIPSLTLGPTTKKLTLVKGKFRIGAGRSVLVRAPLTKLGREALEARPTLRGVAGHMVIVDNRNHEHGQIDVNLVRRPKASLLGKAGRSAGGGHKGEAES